MLAVFQRENVTGVCVVTRYFGGILLGAGGLTRAYTKGARDALAAAGVATMGLGAGSGSQCPLSVGGGGEEVDAADDVLPDEKDSGVEAIMSVFGEAEGPERPGPVIYWRGLTLALMEESYPSRPTGGVITEKEKKEGHGIHRRTDPGDQAPAGSAQAAADHGHRLYPRRAVCAGGDPGAGRRHLSGAGHCLLADGLLLLVDHIRKEREEKPRKQDAADADKE